MAGSPTMIEESKNITAESTEQQTTQEPIHDAQLDELTLCHAERDIWKDKYLRVQADLDNFTKRIDKERIQWRTLAQMNILQDMLSIVDDFDRAFEQQQAHTISAEMQQWLTGFEMIRTSLHKFLAKNEVQEIKIDMPFDPVFHEALMNVNAPEKQSGEIVAILQKGYTFKGSVLRPAKVSVAQ